MNQDILLIEKSTLLDLKLLGPKFLRSVVAEELEI